MDTTTSQKTKLGVGRSISRLSDMREIPWWVWLVGIGFGVSLVFLRRK